MLKKILAAIAALWVSIGITATASAHVPIMEGADSSSFKDALQIPRPGTSYAIYANLDRPGDIDFYSFEVKKSMRGHVSLIVPFRPEYLDFYPVFAVIGPGLPAPQAKIPFALEPGYGAVVISGTSDADRPVFYEPFSRMKYYQGIPKFDRELAEPGIYYIAVWHPGNETGAYVLGYGLAEKFTAKDWKNTFKLLGTIRDGSWETKRTKPSAGCPGMGMMNCSTANPGATCPMMMKMQDGGTQMNCPIMKNQGGPDSPGPHAGHKP